MKSKKIMLILITAIFLVSIAGVCAADANDTLVANKDTSQIELSDNNKIIEDNRQTSGEKLGLSVDDESLSAQTDTNVLGDSPATYSDLAREINAPGTVILKNKSYTYDDGAPAIIISEANKVIDGNGAIIDMTESTIRAFTVSASGVTIKNLTIKNANYNGDGGAIYFSSSGTVSNCNFTNNTATSQGGAIRFSSTGTVSNCNFTNNTAGSNGGAVRMYSGSVENCNFTDNTATKRGGAIYFSSSGTTNEVRNCNFTDNSATDDGGALYMYYGTVTNSKFINNVCGHSGAILSFYWWTVTADTCIFKNDSDSTYQVHILPPTLNVDNFTTFYGSGEKLTFDLKTNSSIPVTNGNISISVYFKENNSWVGNYSCLSGEGWIPVLPVGSYYAKFTTEYAGFQAISKTITITIPNVRYYINVTSLATNNKTVNITAKTNIPQNITWDGKLLFILPNSTQINANYAGNGTWWAVHTFDDYAVYQVNASYDGLNNVTVSNAKITINKADSTITLDNITLNYGESRNVTVATQGAVGITADINGINVTVINNYTIQIADLGAGTYTLTVTTIPDGDYNPVTATSKITVNKIESTLTVNNVELDYGDSINVTVTALGATGITAKIDNVNVTVKAYIIPISGLDVGTYTLTVTTIADANHNPVTRNATVTVNRAKTELAADAIITTYSVSKDLVITLKDANGNALSGAKLTVDLNGAREYVTDANGQVKVNVAKLVPKTYTAIITFNGDDIYAKSTKNVQVIVKKAKAKIVAKKKTFKKAKKVKKYTVTLKANSKALAKVNQRQR